MPSRAHHRVFIVFAMLYAVACGSGASESGANPASTDMSGGADGGPIANDSGQPAPMLDANSDFTFAAADSGDPNLLVADDAIAPLDSNSAGFVGCATDTESATQLPLDMYFMLDTSGSMDDLVADRQSKWSAVASAISSFVNDPASAGLGVGVQYFPMAPSGVPPTCASDADCGGWGPCILNLCDDDSGSSCNSDDDCAGVACVGSAACQYDANVSCDAPGQSCGQDENGFELGACQPAPGVCAQGDSCAVADYQAPAIAIAPLPANAAAIVASLAARSPGGGTPTSPALQGAIAQASAYAAAHPGHTVVAVLATDGIPNEVTGATAAQCEAAPQSPTSGPGSAVAEVADIAAAGLAETPSIKTFGIGVFTPDDVASGRAALQAIAAAGGTTAPFIVQTSAGASDVAMSFEAALTAIRGTSLPCRYAVPRPQTGTPDWGLVNTRFTASSGAVSTVSYVDGPQGCDPVAGGWYYDVDPAEGGVPGTIDICPATCSVFEGDPDGRVDIVIGCRTVVP